MGGRANNAITDNSGIEVIKFDSEGSVEWVGLYGGGASEEGFEVIESHDGGFLITGFSLSFGDTRSYYVFVMKISPFGFK